MLKPESRDLSRWERRSFASIGILQANTCQGALVLAGLNENLQKKAHRFGKNLGLAWQAHTELQPFLQPVYEPVQLAEMPPFPSYDLNCLPVLLFLKNLYDSSNYNLIVEKIRGLKNSQQQRPTGWKVNFDQHRHQDVIDYAALHEIILANEKPVEETYRIIEGYCKVALEQLESFPESESKELLRNICESLYRRD